MSITAFSAVAALFLLCLASAARAATYQAQATLSPPPPTTVTPTSPATGTVNFQRTFSSITQVCFALEFTGDLWDPGETWVISYTGVTGIGQTDPSSSRSSALLCANHPADTSAFLDGQETMTIRAEGGSFTLASLTVTITSNDPTAATLRSHSAAPTKNGTLVRWRTASEIDTLGFNVYRQREGKFVKLNRKLIPSVFGGTATGHAYSWLDRAAPRGAARYRLQAVSLNGERSWVGSTVVPG